MKDCLAAETIWETERYLFRQASGNSIQATNDPLRVTRLAEAEQAFEDAKEKVQPRMLPQISYQF